MTKPSPSSKKSSQKTSLRGKIVLRRPTLLAITLLLAGAILSTVTALTWSLPTPSILLLAQASILVAGAVATLWLSQSISDPLQKVVHAIEELEKGKYKTETLADIIVRDDNLGKLGRSFNHLAGEFSARDRRLKLLRKVIPTGVGLSAEKDFNRLLETIVIESQNIANADGGTLYMIEGNQLKFMIVRNTVMDLATGGTTGVPISFPPLSLINKQTGEPNHCNIATHAALINDTVNIPDAYNADGFDFSGTREFDWQTGYHSQSFLSIPLQNDEQQAIGVLQLINARDPETGEVIPFVADEVFETLVLLASISLTAYIHQAQLRREIEKLNIEIDQTKKTRLVNEITETDYFRDLLTKVSALRAKRKRSSD